MKKEPPDVIVFDHEKENPLTQWINLAEYAERVNDMYLFNRAVKMIYKLSDK